MALEDYRLARSRLGPVDLGRLRHTLVHVKGGYCVGVRRSAITCNKAEGIVTHHIGDPMKGDPAVLNRHRYARRQTTGDDFDSRHGIAADTAKVVGARQVVEVKAYMFTAGATGQLGYRRISAEGHGGAGRTKRANGAGACCSVGVLTWLHAATQLGTPSVGSWT